MDKVDQQPLIPPGDTWYRYMVQSAEGYAVFSTDLQARIVTWDTGAQRLFGFSPQEALGQNARFIFTPEDILRGAPEAELAQASARRSAEDERWHVKKGGELFWASGLMMTLVDDRGRQIGYQKIVRDRTEQKAVRDALKVAKEEVVAQADRLEKCVSDRTAQLNEAMTAMEAFTYSTSHDLRTPLRSMAGFSEILLAEGNLSPIARDYAERIHRAALKMDRLTTDLLTYSRISHLHLVLSPVNLDVLVKTMLTDLESEIRTRKAEVEVLTPLGVVIGHERLLRQAIENLTTNALKFVAPGVSPQVKLRKERIDGWVRIWVEDRGIGIEPAHRERIFALFERLHPEDRYSGTGVGLAIVKHAVVRMDGRTGYESSPNQGSRFWIELPEAPALSGALPA